VTNELNDGQICIDPSVATHRRRIFIKWPCNPLQGSQVNFDIPLFEGLIDANVVDKWLNLLEGWDTYSSRLSFKSPCYTAKYTILLKVGHLLLKVVPHVKEWRDTYSEQRAIE
jgi:hypothetical protein